MPTVYLIHGWFGQAANMDDMAKELQRRGYKVVRIAYSSGLNYGKMRNQVDKKIGNIPRDSIVIGHSLGGVIANGLYGDTNRVIALNSPIFDKKDHTILAANWDDPITLLSLLQADEIGQGGHAPADINYDWLEATLGVENVIDWMDPYVRNM